MSIYVDITKHDKKFINVEGQEVYPPGHPYQGMARPATDCERATGLPPKSEAEERMEVEASMDDESRAAIELLKSKGLLK
ncbi:MAG: hypothetical protein WCH76_08030 [Candidatus Riflemargulisbacteria bacterium]